MDIKVKNLFVKISPTKIRPLAKVFKGENVGRAIDRLSFISKKGAPILVNLLKSARAAAKEKYLDEENLTIEEIACNDGPRLKRSLPGSRGRAYKVQKRMSNLYLTISGSEEKIEQKKETATKGKTK